MFPVIRKPTKAWLLKDSEQYTHLCPVCEQAVLKEWATDGYWDNPRLTSLQQRGYAQYTYLCGKCVRELGLIW